MHPVQAADEGGLAAAGGTDERGCMVGLHLEANVMQRLRGPVPGVQVFNLDSDAHDLSDASQGIAPDGDTHGGDRSHDQNNQDQRPRPGLAMPIIIRRNGVGEDLKW